MKNFHILNYRKKYDFTKYLFHFLIKALYYLYHKITYMTLMETLEHHRTLDNLYNSHTKPHLMTLAERQEHIGNLESQTKTP